MINMNYRYIARIKVEAATPLFIGSGEASLVTDSLVQKDHNGIPLINGSSLAGVLRHSIEDLADDPEKWNDVFGYQGDGNDGLGSRLIVSSAYFLHGDGKVVEDIDSGIDIELQYKLSNLPNRQHVRITQKGVASEHGLFNNEVLYKGARFIFEIELKGTITDMEYWKKNIGKINSPMFRIGQGTRNGYGNLKVIGIYSKIFKLDEKNEFDNYLNWNPSFNAELEFVEAEAMENQADYELHLLPDDFFIFSEGYGDEEVDIKPVTEEVMEYFEGGIEFKTKTLIPASSIKGAIAHRVAFHYNKIKGIYADRIGEDASKYLGENNQAVAMLFGKKGNIDKETKMNLGHRGILIMDDLYYDDIDNQKIFNHVAIDRFTGGAIDGALFSEKVSHKANGTINIQINLSQPIDGIDTDIIKSLDNTLEDVCKGLLPLGGMTTKGFGMFTGKLFKKGKVIFEYNLQNEAV